MHPFISVIIVSYNYAHFLQRALNACLNQSFKDFEIVIVNNGSTDNTQEIIDKFYSEHPDLRIIVKLVEKNIGPANGYNTGIAAAAGEYIMFNDADDWMEINCLESLAAIAKETEADRVFGFYRHVDQKNNELRIVSFEDGMSFWLILAFQGNIYRKSIFLEHNISSPLDILAVDAYIGSRFQQYSRKNAYYNKVVYNRLVNPYSTAGAKSRLDSVNLTRVQFERIFMPIYNEIADTDIKEGIEYALIKYFYTILLFYNRYNSYHETLKNYKAAREIIRNNLPCYLTCRKLSLFRKNGDRKTGRRMTWILSRLEKTHLMSIALLFYVFLSKIIYFRSR
jgi:glycosyltransferase involved in cell wall biosynthesis